MSEVSSSERWDEALGALPGWQWQADRAGIAKSFRFADFSESFGFMTRVALLAEQPVTWSGS